MSENIQDPYQDGTIPADADMVAPTDANGSASPDAEGDGVRHAERSGVSDAESEEDDTEEFGKTASLLPGGGRLDEDQPSTGESGLAPLP